MLKLVAKIASHRLQFCGHGGRDLFAGHCFPSRMGQLAGFKSESFQA